MVTVRVLGAVTVAALVVSACGGASPAKRAESAQRAVAYPLYWAGPTLAGLELTDVLHQPKLTTFVYGSCKASGDSGCAPPLEIQVAAVCDRKLSIKPKARFHARGVLVLDYGDDHLGHLELSSGGSRVVVWAAPELARRVLAALRPVRDQAPPRPRLPAGVACPSG
jgi:hypothetical protein